MDPRAYQAANSGMSICLNSYICRDHNTSEFIRRLGMSFEIVKFTRAKLFFQREQENFKNSRKEFYKNKLTMLEK